MLNGFAIDGIADHFNESGDAWVFRDEAVVPALLSWPDEHQFEPALPDHLATEAHEHWSAVAAIGRIGFRARRGPSVRVGGTVEQPDQIEHVDRSGAIV